MTFNFMASSKNTTVVWNEKTGSASLYGMMNNIADAFEIDPQSIVPLIGDTVQLTAFVHKRDESSDRVKPVIGDPIEIGYFEFAVERRRICGSVLDLFVNPKLIIDSVYLKPSEIKKIFDRVHDKYFGCYVEIDDEDPTCFKVTILA